MDPSWFETMENFVSHLFLYQLQSSNGVHFGPLSPPLACALTMFLQMNASGTDLTQRKAADRAAILFFLLHQSRVVFPDHYVFENGPHGQDG